MSASVPTFAVVGAVNHGKSSVVSTLSEDDEVPISEQAGWTTRSFSSKLRDYFIFFDTPGFQNPFEALRELQAAPRTSDHLKRFRDFVARHQSDPEFAAECELFRPIIDGAGIIYVVDGSRAVLEHNVAEMELLRLTGQPRLAVINRTSTDKYVEDWKQHLRPDFNNGIQEFNAHAASFSDRIRLLEALADTKEEWKRPLREAVDRFRDEWNSRIGDCAEFIVDLLVECLRHRESAAIPESESERKRAAEKLKQTYMQAISRLESRTHARIIDLFRHRLVQTETDAEELLSDDLFSEDTWQMFGLNEKQLQIHATWAGAAIGLIIDAATLGHSFGLAALTGAVGGWSTAFLLGKSRPELQVEIPSDKLPFLPRKWRRLNIGKDALVVGPYKAINFPWIILDRAIGTFCYVANRAHARRDKVVLNANQLDDALKKNEASAKLWPAKERKECEEIFTAIRGDKLTREQRGKLRALILDHLNGLSARRMQFDDAPAKGA